ncbi:hypothetical protein D9M73_178940 [compost metagenome]
MLGHDMHPVFMPEALDVQPVRVLAAAAITNAFRRGDVLKRNVLRAHSVFILNAGWLKADRVTPVRCA